MGERMSQATQSLKGVPSFPVAVLAGCVVIVAVVSLVENLVAGAVATVALIIGLWGSYELGQKSVTGGDVRPRIRGSYRRMATLHAQLYALTEVVARQRDASLQSDSQVGERTAATLEMIEFAIGQNLSVVADAMEDWADIVPEEVADLRQKAERRRAEIAQLDLAAGLEDARLLREDEDGA